MTMPRAATTWVTTGMLRAMARQKEGLKRMHWLAEMIINAAPPRATWPLFHEGKLMGLDKLSGHGRSVEDLMEAAQQAYTAPGDLEMEAQERVKAETQASSDETESGSSDEEAAQPAEGGGPDWRRVGVRVVAVHPSIREAAQPAEGERRQQGAEAAELKLDAKGVIERLEPRGGALVRWDDDNSCSTRPEGWYQVAPVAAWAGEEARSRWWRMGSGQSNHHRAMRSCRQRAGAKGAVESRRRRRASNRHSKGTGTRAVVIIADDLGPVVIGLTCVAVELQ